MAEKRIRMIASLAGDDFSFAPDQELVVGKDVSEELAIALCTAEQGEEPRAVPIGWAPPGVTAEEETVDEKPDERKDEQGVEQATSPDAETRETATQPRGKRSRPTPPKDTDSE